MGTCMWLMGTCMGLTGTCMELTGTCIGAGGANCIRWNGAGVGEVACDQYGAPITKLSLRVSKIISTLALWFCTLAR